MAIEGIGSMGKNSIGFAHWPFAKDEKVKLIKISKPYSIDGLWYIDAAYLSVISNRVKYLKHYFGDLHLLVCGAEYVNGKKQAMEDWVTVDVYFKKELISYRRPNPYLNKDRFNEKYNYYTFGLKNKGIYYIIPLHELLRAGLAPDVFWLNQVTTLDSIDTRVVYKKRDNSLLLTFLSDVSAKYVKIDEKIKHAAWLFSNPDIFQMMNQSFYSIRNGDGIRFDFLFEELHFKAKVERKEDRAYVKEIISFKRKKINCYNILVEHPGLVDYSRDSSEREKKWMPVEMASGDRLLVPDKTAVPNKLDIDKYNGIQSEYNTSVKIQRIKNIRTGGHMVTSKTIPKYIEGKAKRTTADFGGLDTVPQIEFENNVQEKFEGLFSDILSVFKLMEKRDEVVSIRYHVGNLNDHYQYRSICTLADNVTTRKYLAGKIELLNGKEAMFVEVERERIALSTLILISDITQNWNLVCHQVIKGLIKESGSWPDIEAQNYNNIDIYKFKHTNVDIAKKEKRIFDIMLK